MPIEDLTTYTLVGAHISRNVNTCTFTDLDRDGDSRLFDDKEVGHFNSDFEHLVDVEISSSDNSAQVAIWLLSNTVDDILGLVNASEDFHSAVIGSTSGGTRFLSLEERVAGVRYKDNTGTYSLNTPYYLKIKRDETVGVFGQTQLFQYSDSDKTILVDTLSVLLHEKEDFQYVFICNNWNSSSAQAITGTISNLDLQEVVAGVKTIIHKMLDFAYMKVYTTGKKEHSL